MDFKLIEKELKLTKVNPEKGEAILFLVDTEGLSYKGYKGNTQSMAYVIHKAMEKKQIEEAVFMAVVSSLKGVSFKEKISELFPKAVKIE